MKLIIAIFISHLAGIIGGIATSSSVGSWYQTVPKPWFNPPSYVFGPVWLCLYTLMGISLYRIWKKEKTTWSKLSIIFYIHLIVNALWSIVFFGLQNIFAAFIIICILWLMIIWLINIFNKKDKIASYLLIPYLLWVTFASILNVSLIYLYY